MVLIKSETESDDLETLTVAAVHSTPQFFEQMVEESRQRNIERKDDNKKEKIPSITTICARREQM